MVNRKEIMKLIDAEARELAELRAENKELRAENRKVTAELKEYKDKEFWTWPDSGTDAY